MRAKLLSLVIASVLLAACAREATNSDGNGPGNADGVGGREDPATAPATQDGEPAGSTPPATSESPPPAQ
jgi:hypothetical protein